MLKYEVRLGKDNFKKEKLVWSEKYLSPDLSVITGVTSPEYHLEKFNTLAATNSIINSDGAVHVECKNVQRQGFIVLKEKEYETFTGKTIDYSSDKKGKEIEYSYLVNNDKYFYWGAIPNTTNVSGYSINNLLNMVEDSNGYDIFETINVPCGKNDNPIKIDTLYWIEDGRVTIDGHQYIYDRNEGDNGILKFGENGNALDITAITKCKSVEFYPYESSNDYEEVTKFKLTKQPDTTKDFEKITFSKYYYYIKYKEHYCQIKKKGDGSSFSFVCEIPKYVLSGGTEEENLEPIEFDVYFSEEENDVDSYKTAREAGNKIDSSKYNKHNVKNLEELVNVIAFVYVKDDDSYFTVEHDILNANAGNMIAVYLEDEHAPLKIGNKIKFVDNGSGNHESLIYDSGLYDGVSGDIYATYNGNKYKVKPNICDKVIINENEYDIDYINGKVADKDCIVIISGERVPMKIIDDSIDGGKLERYGKIVSGSTPQESKIATATYDIKTYSGITINGKDYIIYDREDLNGNITHYAALDLSPQYVFVIKEIVGSSMYLCKPEINDTDFTDEFDRYLSELICKDVVDNQATYELFIQNKIFGETEITKDLAFKMTETPISSDDFYNVFDDISILVNTFYIHIPVSLRMDVANNTMQQDITTRDFFEAEKKKAINPIVDMEKDIYAPKFIDNSDEIKKGNVKGEDRYKYVGSKTTFKPIYKINVNFHFRTRNLDSWKVNDGYNNIDYAADNADNTNSNDNWFITDFYPYREILNTKRGISEKPPEGRLRNFTWKERVNMLQETSDLMGLLYFTNDDIFYQRSKVAKSFARLSFYDSTDPQTQSLLATSCIFVDEHKLFKTFIDNSRKNNYEYGAFAEPEYEKDESGFTNPSPKYLSGTTSLHDNNQKNDITELRKYNKISIYTEFLGGKKLNRENNIPYSSVTDDSYNIILDESRRISSRLVVDNKHTTDTSSEGFYIYIFREYAENLHPKPIYMKVEFNHAGIGKMIPFLIPMHWSGNTGDTSSVKYNKMYPDHALMMSSTSANSITNLNDLQELKRGIPLTYTYAQTYIPLYAVYDFKNKEYGYVFDSRYVEVDCNGVLNLNLFEMKVMNESDEVIDEDTEEGKKKLNDIKLNRQERAIINVNEKQFDRRHFKYRME